MSADDPFPVLDNERKPAAKKWREKLFSKDKNKSSTDQQIEAFLATARTRSASNGPLPVAPNTRELPVPPRLEVAPRWPTAQELQHLKHSQNSPPDSIDSCADPYPPVTLSKPLLKARVRKGLRVKFTNQGPTVIGEGGDESEEPTIEISRSRGRNRSPSQPDDFDPAQYKSQLRLDTSFPDGDGPIPRQRGLERKDTRAVRSDANPKPLLIQNTQDADFLMTLNLGESGSRLSFRGSPESNSFAQRVRAKMENEEGRALQHGYDEPGSPVNEAPPDSPNSLYETPPISETESVPPPNIVRGTPSPQRTRNAYLDDHALPSGLTPGGGSRARSPPKPHLAPRDIFEDGSVRPHSRDNRDAPMDFQAPKISLRSVANQVGETAFAEFQSYATRYESEVRLSAERVKPLMETSLGEWMRAAVWWFMRGKKRLEVYARSRPSSSGSRPPQRSSPESAKQAVVDLVKALWINERIIPQHDELTRYGEMSMDSLAAVATTTGDQQLADYLGLHQTIMSHLRSLSVSIKRNNILSLLAADGDSMNVDTSVWVVYPFFAPDVSAVLSGATTRSMLVDKPGKGPKFVQMMPLGDTNRHFSYGNMFVDVCVSSSEDDSQQFSMPCALSIIRDRADWYVLVAISSQSELVNVVIQSDRKKGPTWDDVDWQVRSQSMTVKLPRGFELDVMFQEDDFKNLWNIVQYTLKTEASLQPEPGESVIFESTLKMFQYMDPGTPKAFPAESIERCRLRLFEREVKVTEGTGTRNAHRGFRIAVLTSPKVKTLSNVRHILGYGAPVIFGLLRGEDGAPALLLKVKEDGRTRSMLMTFQEVRERNTLHSMLLAMMAREREFKLSDIPIRSFAIEQPSDRMSGQPAKEHLRFPGGNVSVIDQEHDFIDHGYGPTILSESLRAFVATEWGSATDRINLGPGELKLGLDVNNRTGLSLYRPAQHDLTVSVAENLVPPEIPDKLTDFLQAAMTKPMVRRFDFTSLKGLHAFQAAVTGFTVLFDSIASSFMISRRRMVVPITKKWESSLARIQIIRQDKVIQLLAFLNDFSHGKCMNFVLKSTDTFESFNRSGKFCVRIIDAKFALPKTDNDPASDFVCLDMPDYPIEHDDISIVFDSETGHVNNPTRDLCYPINPPSTRNPSSLLSLSIDPHPTIPVRALTMSPIDQTVGVSTRSLHADDALNVVADVAPPLHVSTTFRYSDDPEKLVPLEDLSGYDQDKTTHVYSRLSAPNPTRFETILSSLLNGESISYSSGLSAFHAALVLLNPRRIAIGNGYHGCHGVIEMFSRLTGLQKLDLDCPAEKLEAGDVVHLETPVNPDGTSFNIEAYAKKAHSRGAYLVVDGTFAPPCLQDPFQWGADLVMHSGSKYFGGHSDVLCGVLATQRKDWARQLFQDRLFLGSVMGNMEGWLGVRSLRTLEVRVQRQSQNTTNLVSWLSNALQMQNAAAGSDESVTQSALGKVLHSSLQKADESWLLKQMPNGFGPVFSIIMKEEDFARKLPSKLSFFQHATSLGGVETLIEWRTMSDKTVDRRLLRISVGLENWEDLRQDLVNAFRELIAGK